MCDFELDATVFEISVWEGFSENTGQINVLLYFVDRASRYSSC